MRRFIFGALVALTPAFAFAQADNPAWVDQLTEQAARTLGCEVGYLVSMREYRLGERDIEEARLQCVDGRRFDASRASPDPAFTFKACGEQVC